MRLLGIGLKAVKNRPKGQLFSNKTHFFGGQITSTRALNKGPIEPKILVL
jgi:hypothetical protein